METAAKDEVDVDIWRALQVEGWTNEEELGWLAEQAQLTGESSKIVEIGVFLGRSALALADNADWGSVIYCVDSYASYDDEGVASVVEAGSWDSVYEQAKGNLYFPYGNLESSNRVVFFREASTRAALRFLDHSIDMIFIDGDHSYSAVMADITAWERTIKPGGLICGHDYNVHPGVKQAVDERFSFGRLKFPVGSIWAVKKPLVGRYWA